MAGDLNSRLTALVGALTDRLLDVEARLATAERAVGIDPAAAAAGAKAARENAAAKPAKRIGRRTTKE
ncbi:ribosomal protein L12E/L44/L45/RPP1/RPP2 [Constrictibacter sp. MBR-5]|jgi:ribosomal protein L12E/L44/L45/RPP1/RPP2|uniref:hypothetical protein n=1 Tax=Constrictibacter sp. MBR-5 TaxID=3156467 RepID=UPI003393667C